MTRMRCHYCDSIGCPNCDEGHKIIAVALLVLLVFCIVLAAVAFVVVL